MKKFDLLIFTQHPKSYAPNRLYQEALKLRMSVKIIDYAKLPSVFPISRFVILREPDPGRLNYQRRDKILKFYKNKSILLNPKTYLKWPILDKFVQHKVFKKENIPFIKLLRLKDAEYPFVVKSRLGSHGSHVFKIEKEEDLKTVLAKGYKEKDLLVQEFQTSGFDLRIIVLGKKTLEIMQRIPQKGNFLSNYSQGGSVVKYNGPEKEKITKIALKAAKAFSLEYCGVDIMKGNDGKWKVLEVNRACQFKGFEKATGINVARNIIDFLKSKKSV